MPDQRAIELIQLRIDGVIGAAESDELEALLATDPEARALAAEFESLQHVLDTLPGEEPPATLAASIMARVRSATRHAAPASFAAASAKRRRTIVSRIGLGLAAALAAVFAFVPSLRDSIDPRHASGTMIGDEATGASREIPIRGERISGSIRVITRGDRVTLALSFEDAASRQLRLAFDPSRFALELPAAGGESAAPAASGVVSIDLSDASTRVSLVRNGPGPGSVSLTVVQSGDVYETTIDLGQ